jgi:hypothetical protein
MRDVNRVPLCTARRIDRRSSTDTASDDDLDDAFATIHRQRVCRRENAPGGGTVGWGMTGLIAMPALFTRFEVAAAPCRHRLQTGAVVAALAIAGQGSPHFALQTFGGWRLCRAIERSRALATRS